MSDQEQAQPDLALSAASYSPPAAVTTNVSQADIARLIAEAVQSAVASERAAREEASKPKMLSPEEEARAALDKALAAQNDGEAHGLGVEERLQELYRLVALVASKVGI